MSDIGDHRARQQAVDSVNSVLVQAPAGSGKTTLLTQRYLRLLAQVDSPERILALTFTRLAAQEMRRRVLDALGRSARVRLVPGAHELAHLGAGTGRAATYGGAAARCRRAAGSIAHRNHRRLQCLAREPIADRCRRGIGAAGDDGCQAVLPGGGAPRPGAHRGGCVRHAVERVLELDDQRWVSWWSLITDMLAARDRWLPLLAGNLRAASALRRGAVARAARALSIRICAVDHPQLVARARGSGSRKTGKLLAIIAGGGSAWGWRAAKCWLCGSEPCCGPRLPMSIAGAPWRRHPAHRRSVAAQAGQRQARFSARLRRQSPPCRICWKNWIATPPSARSAARAQILAGPVRLQR